MCLLANFKKSNNNEILKGFVRGDAKFPKMVGCEVRSPYDKKSKFFSKLGNIRLDLILINNGGTNLDTP